jgi:hypothetical protein
MRVESYVSTRLPAFALTSRDRALKHIGIPLRYCPDFVYRYIKHAQNGQKLTHYIIVEVDEHQHNSYKPDKEYLRYTRISFAIHDTFASVYWIRFNPHGYRCSTTCKISLDERIKELRKRIRAAKHLGNGVEWMYYSERNKHKAMHLN